MVEQGMVEDVASCSAHRDLVFTEFLWPDILLIFHYLGTLTCLIGELVYHVSDAKIKKKNQFERRGQTTEV